MTRGSRLFSFGFDGPQMSSFPLRSLEFRRRNLLGTRTFLLFLTPTFRQKTLAPPRHLPRENGGRGTGGLVNGEPKSNGDSPVTQNQRRQQRRLESKAGVRAAQVASERRASVFAEDLLCVKRAVRRFPPICLIQLVQPCGWGVFQSKWLEMRR